MSMYCMKCSAIGLAPLTVACGCGSMRWRGTYELPGEPSSSPRPNIAVHGAPGAAMNVAKDAAGNFIEATPETPYFQIGESKYGKPVLDRAIKYDVDLYEALKIGLVSMDSTMRSNLGVGMPIDLLCYARDSLKVTVKCRFASGDAYFETLKHQWIAGTRRVFHDLPSLEG